jgi:chemotaxis signal transduction protein
MAQWAMPSDTLPENPPDACLPVLLMRVAGQSLAIRQQDVVEVLPLPRLTPMPEAPPIVLGVFHLAGEVVPVLPMAALLGLTGPAEGPPLYHHLLLLRKRPGRPRLAVLADRVTETVQAAATLPPRGQSFNDCVVGDIRLDGALVPVLTADRLLTAYECARIAAFAARLAEREAAFSPAALS